VFAAASREIREYSRGSNHDWQAGRITG
jgi:hypothetical protein